MKFFFFILTLLTLCDVYNELNDFIGKRLQKFKCEENNFATEIYPNINKNFTTLDPLNSSNFFNTSDIVYYLIVRGTTRNCNDDNLLMSNYNVFFMQNSLTEMINFKWNSDNYYLRLKWFYLGKYLTKTRYSPLVHVPTDKMTKCILLILMLLLMCRDTGISANPGSTSST